VPARVPALPPMRPVPSRLLCRCLPVLVVLNVGARPVPQEFRQKVALHHGDIATL
jgi:hypothetical protein